MRFITLPVLRSLLDSSKLERSWHDLGIVNKAINLALDGSYGEGWNKNDSLGSCAQSTFSFPLLFCLGPIAWDKILGLQQASGWKGTRTADGGR